LGVATVSDAKVVGVVDAKGKGKEASDVYCAQALAYNGHRVSCDRIAFCTLSRPLFAHYHARRGREEKKCRAGDRRKKKESTRIKKPAV